VFRVWVLLLFFSPILSSILLQLYIFASTGALVRTEGILIQLVFEHALRIRMKEDAPRTKGTSMPNTPKAQAFDLSPADNGERSSADFDGASTPATTAVEGTTTAAAGADNSEDVGPPTPSKNTSPPPTPLTPSKPNGQEEDSSPSGANLAGRINNLISTDLENITDSRDFMFLFIYAPLQTAMCIGFLYILLGWSSFVGMSVMILGIWAPVQIGKWTHSVQVRRMKAVCPLPFDGDRSLSNTPF
jgi:ABC transporter transmembrane region